MSQYEYKPYHQREDRNLFSEFVQQESASRAPTYQNWKIVIRGLMTLAVFAIWTWYNSPDDDSASPAQETEARRLHR